MELFLEDFLTKLPWWQLTIMGLLAAFIISYFTIPSIVSVSQRMNLYEKTNNRGSHQGSIPTLGGIAIFAGFVISGAIFLPETILPEYRYVLAALVILFFTGVKDDLVGIDPKKKLLSQIAVALIITLLGDVRITSFHGIFLGIEAIPYLIIADK